MMGKFTFIFSFLRFRIYCLILTPQQTIATKNRASSIKQQTAQQVVNFRFVKLYIICPLYFHPCTTLEFTIKNLKPSNQSNAQKKILGTKATTQMITNMVASCFQSFLGICPLRALRTQYCMQIEIHDALNQPVIMNEPQKLLTYFQKKTTISFRKKSTLAITSADIGSPKGLMRNGMKSAGMKMNDWEMQRKRNSLQNQTIIHIYLIANNLQARVYTAKVKLNKQHKQENKRKPN